MQGWRTLLFNLAVVMLTALLTFVAGVDWAAYGIRPEIALIIVGLANIILRCITTTPVFSQKDINSSSGRRRT